MAYKINRTDEFVVDHRTADGPATQKDVRNALIHTSARTPEFYELEPAEVIEVALNEIDLPPLKSGLLAGKPDWSKYGWIKARMTVSSKGPNDYILAAPLDTNIKQYPLPGEVVVVVEYFDQLYYTEKINMNQSVSFNFNPDISISSYSNDTHQIPKIKHFEHNTKIKELMANEGDIIFNGRFGQSIRFGSNITEFEDESWTGKPDSPNIKIRTGQGLKESVSLLGRPTLEDINRDRASIYMTTNELIGLEFSNTKTTEHYNWKYDPDAVLKESKIVLNADRVVFQGRGNILQVAEQAITLSANEEIGFEVPEEGGSVQLGQWDADQPVLGGDQTMKLISQLIDALNEFAGGLSSAVGGPGLPWKPTALSPINAAAAGLRGSLTALKNRLDEPKSKTVFVGHMKGPK